VKPISWRAQWWCVGAGYAAVSAVAVAAILGRFVMERRYAASDGMYAAGDLFLGIFIVCLFMIPTVALIWVMSKSEALYTGYSQLLVGISLSAPVSLSLFWWGNKYLSQNLLLLCLCRLLLSPFALVGTGVSRLVARFARAKKLVSYALLIEGLTLAVSVGLLIHWWGKK
jgi:hypothetical protein